MLCALGSPATTDTGRARLWFALVGLCCLTTLVDRLYVRQSGEFTAQAATNVHFAERPTWTAALVHYQKQRPPLYPILMRAWSGAGLPLLRMNEALGILTLVLLCAAARRLALSEGLTFAVALLW